jgi:hypothetical protein
MLENDSYALDPLGLPSPITDGRNAGEWPPSFEPVNRTIGYDAFYRATSVTYGYVESASYSSPTPTATPAESPFPLMAPTSSTTRIGKESSVYDPFGNRTSSTDEEERFFDRSLGTIQTGSASGAFLNNQLASATLPGTTGGRVSTKYDAAGNLVRLDVLRSGTCESSTGCNQLFQYDWDEVGRLARARRYDFVGGQSCVSCGEACGGGRKCGPNPLPTDPDNAWPALPSRPADADVQFAYDAGGQRVLRATTGSASAGTTYTVDIFPTLRLADTTFGVESPRDYDRSDETDQVSLVAGSNVLGRVLYAPADPGTASNVLLPGQHVFLELVDHLGSTTTVIDQQTSELVERTTYSAFGRIESDYRPERWSNFREAFKFTGKEDDI